MAKSGGGSGDDWATVVLGLIGAGLIGVAAMELLKAIGTKEYRYKCPKCTAPIQFEQHSCQNCGVNLTWKTNEQGNATS